jgi:hypothetical protein
MSVKARQTSGSKLDLHRLHRDEYAPAREPIIVDVGEGRYLAVDGRGEPGGPEFQDKLGALYGMAFTIKMTRKHAGLGDYVIAGLEGQYWPDPGVSALDAPLDIMNWRLMVRTPEAVTEDDLDAARSTLKQRDRGAWVDNVMLVSMAEGPSVQMLHVGPYEAEPATIGTMVEFARAQGFEVHGHHHEIYLSDPRRVPPERLRTILRLPVRKGG